jgi:hypothetical protein
VAGKATPCRPISENCSSAQTRRTRPASQTRTKKLRHHPTGAAAAEYRPAELRPYWPRDPLLDGVVFSDQVIDEVTEFMKALTDPSARNIDAIIPDRVPSGLTTDGQPGSWETNGRKDRAAIRELP